MPAVASSTHSHPAHARTHAAHHAKAQSGSDFAAMLEEMAAAKSDTPADAGTPNQSPATEQNPAVKADETGIPAQVVTPASVPAPTPLPAPTGETPNPDQQLKTACQDLTNSAAPKLPQKQDLVSGKEPKPDGGSDSGDIKQPAVTDKPVLRTAPIISQTGNAVAAVTPATPATPAQPAVPAEPSEQQAKPDTVTPALPAVAAVIAPAARQLVADVKPAKTGQALAQADADVDDQPQGVAAPQEQGAASVAGAKAAIPAVPAQPADKAAAPEHRPSFEDASAKSDAAQTFDDLLNAPTAQTGAAALNGPGAAAANQTTASAAAASNTPAPQAQLAPVPLSGIPVLIAGKAFEGSNHFDIRLDPPELGRIEVRLKVDRDGQVSSHLIADRADTLALLRRDQTGLERALQDAGLKTTGDGLQFSLRDQGGNGQPDGRAPSPGLLVPDSPLPDLPPRGYAVYTARAGGIDIHV